MVVSVIARPSVGSGMFLAIPARPSSMVSVMLSVVLGVSSVACGISFVIAGLPSMISRWIREDHRRGSSYGDCPDRKRNARAAVYSSKHEISPPFWVSGYMQSYPGGEAPRFPNCGDCVAMW